MKRVEVIKEPQTTLFGTASAVGAISLSFARPRYSATLTAGYGNLSQTIVSGFVNAGDGEARHTLGVRVAEARQPRA